MPYAVHHVACPAAVLETTDAPQILEHINQSVTFTPYETRWIPCSARCVVMGLYPRGTGVLQVWELDKGEFKVIKEVRVGVRALGTQWRRK